MILKDFQIFNIYTPLGLIDAELFQFPKISLRNTNIISRIGYGYIESFEYKGVKIIHSGGHFYDEQGNPFTKIISLSNYVMSFFDSFPEYTDILKHRK